MIDLIFEIIFFFVESSSDGHDKQGSEIKKDTIKYLLLIIMCTCN